MLPLNLNKLCASSHPAAHDVRVLVRIRLTDSREYFLARTTSTMAKSSSENANSLFGKQFSIFLGHLACKLY